MTSKAKKVHTVAIASYEFAGSTATVVAAIRDGADAGMTPTELAVEFKAGRIAKAILEASGKKASDAARDKAIDRGIAICLACEPGRKPKNGQAMRSAEDQALFEPTKRWWSRMGRDAGVIKPRAKSGKPGKGKGKPGKGKATGAFVVKTPKDTTAALLSVQNMLHMLATYCAKHVKLLPADVTAKCNRTSVEVDEIAKTM